MIQRFFLNWIEGITGNNSESNQLKFSFPVFPHAADPSFTRPYITAVRTEAAPDAIFIMVLTDCHRYSCFDLINLMLNLFSRQSLALSGERFIIRLTLT